MNVLLINVNFYDVVFIVLTRKSWSLARNWWRHPLKWSFRVVYDVPISGFLCVPYSPCLVLSRDSENLTGWRWRLTTDCLYQAAGNQVAQLRPTSKAVSITRNSKLKKLQLKCLEIIIIPQLKSFSFSSSYFFFCYFWARVKNGKETKTQKTNRNVS